LGTEDGDGLTLETNNAERLRVDATGNIGIGTASPGYSLHLAAGKTFRIEGGTSANDGGAHFTLGGWGSLGIDAPGVPNGRFVVQNSGNVGIGTATPSHSLHLAPGKALRIEGAGNVFDQASYFTLGGLGVFGIDAPGVPNGRFVVQNSGNVGIGTATPSHSLHLAAGKTLRIEGGTTVSDDTAYFTLGEWGTFGIDAPGVPNGRFVVQNSGNIGIGTASPGYSLHLAAGKALRIEGGESDSDHGAYFSLGGWGSFGIDAPGVPGGRFVVQSSGNVGIGTNWPVSKLDVNGDVRIGLSGNLYVNASLFVDQGNVGIGTRLPAYKLDVNGDVALSGNLYVNRDISVTGDVLLTGADCAEHFDVSGSARPEPGTVVVIDEQGALRESYQAYDKKVAGIVSGAGEYKPGLVLDNRPSQEGRVPVALIGKVFCKVDARYSPVRVGDLLTTSPTPGHAMKAGEPSRAFGAVIGKALKPLREGHGLIPVLIALQ
jgi:hypothetical protein